MPEEAGPEKRPHTEAYRLLRRPGIDPFRSRAADVPRDRGGAFRAAIGPICSLTSG